MEQPSRQKRRGALLGLYDLPLYRDWAAWCTAAWLIISMLALGTGQKAKTELPRWLDVVLGALLFAALFGVLPAAIRRGLRKVRQRRRGTTRMSQAPGDAAHSGYERADRTPPSGETASAPPAPEPTPPRRSAPRSTPSSASPGMDASASVVLIDAQRSMPFPVAHAARRLRSATTAKDQYEQTLRAGETLATTIGMAVVAALRHDIAANDEFLELRRALGGPGTTFGNWGAALAHVRSLIRGDTEPLDGLAAALAPGRKGTGGLVSDLQALAAERNDWAHGRGPQTASACFARLDEIFPLLERSLQRGEFLSRSPWIVVESCALRRGQTGFSVVAGDVMSDHPDFEHRTFETPVALILDTVYMMARGGPIDMTPFVVVHDCPECRQTELCHADGIDRRGSLVLKSFARGHRMVEPTLAADLRDLFGAA